MKREEILFYLTSDKMYVYLLKSKKEFVRKMDTSLFFKCGEIANVDRCAVEVSKIVAEMNFGLYYLRPNVTVLYNDVCDCDVKFLYKGALSPMSANKIFFVPITKLVKAIRKGENVVLKDGDCYTLINKRQKCKSLATLDFDPIVIGDEADEYVHYSDKEIVWKTFKEHFTKDRNYDMMNVGDDYV